MAYSTVDDLVDQIEEQWLIQLTDDEGLGQINTTRAEKAIADADEEINGYIGSRHAVPLSPVPGIVRKCSVDIAIYNLYGRKDSVPEARKDRHKNAVHFLEQVALGKISLGAHDPEGNPPASDAPQLSIDNPERIFTRSSMRGY
jgi:phage gp36-like protein